jgi:phosphoglycolate phosphatase-like HAD superfamily hydrolase
MPDPCVIFDLDGTIFNNDHRLHYLWEEPRNWRAFFDACVDDKPNQYVIWLCNQLHIAGHTIFICTSRPCTHMVPTLKCLREHKVSHDWLMMREGFKNMPDWLIKRNMLHTIREQGFEPVFAVDDRPTVVKMWRANGVPCLVPDASGWHAKHNRDDLLESEVTTDEFYRIGLPDGFGDSGPASIRQSERCL